MTTRFGRPAVEVEQPGGELLGYLVEPVAAPPGYWLAWVLTSEPGDRYTVCMPPAPVAGDPSEGWTCTCKDFANRNRWCRKRPRGAPCKHIDSVREEQQEATRAAAGTAPGADPAGRPGENGGDPVRLAGGAGGDAPG